MLALSLTLAASLAVAPVPSPTHTGDAPRPRADIVDTAVAAGSFGTLVTAVQAAGLVDTLKSDGPFTVFAPTDDAFAKLDPAVLQLLLTPQGKDALTQVLTYHVVAGRVAAVDAIRAGEAATVEGDAVRFTIGDGQLKVNDSRVVANDLATSNGVIHVIDTVLLPPDLALPNVNGRKVIGVYTDQPGKALASQLGLDRHKTLLITSLTKGGNAARDGLKAYDVLTSIDGMPATDSNLKKAKEARGVGGQVQLELLRGGERRTVAVTVGVDTH